MDGKVYVPKDVYDPPNTASITQTNGVLKKAQLTNGNAANGVNGSTTYEIYEDKDPDIQVTQIFADFIATADKSVLSRVLREKLKEVIIDYIGVTAAAAKSADSSESIYNVVIALGGANGSSTVLTKGKKSTPQYAAFLNAAFGHSLDFDDTYAEGTLHAGVTAISAALAQAEVSESSSTCDNFLTAIAIGYEITCRLGKALGFEP